MNGIAMLICQDLEFDMPGLYQVFLNQDGCVTECRLGDAHGSSHSLLQPLLIIDNLHTDPPSTGTCLDDNRVAYLPRHLFCIVYRTYAAFCPGDNRDPRIPHHLLTADLGSHFFDCLPAWADKDEIFIQADLCKAVVLR